MYVVDVTVVVSLILGASAIISPIVTTIISNCHATKIYKLNMREKHYADTNLRIRTIFETYIRRTGAVIKYSDDKNLVAYSEAYFHALLYAPEDIRSDMIHINSILLNRCEASKQLEHLVSKIHAMLLLK